MKNQIDVTVSAEDQSLVLQSIGNIKSAMLPEPVRNTKFGKHAGIHMVSPCTITHRGVAPSPEGTTCNSIGQHPMYLEKNKTKILCRNR